MIAMGKKHSRKEWVLAVLPKTAFLTLFNISLVGVAEGGSQRRRGRGCGSFIEGVIGGSVPWNIKEAFSNLECDLLHVQWKGIEILRVDQVRCLRRKWHEGLDKATRAFNDSTDAASLQ
ncbi:hypothetical protein NC651_002203 [Populus alba x Populus x berolinensis]|nr:hypothetical protein NC651_002203 [Populus alba x Populus x berolinensis]